MPSSTLEHSPTEYPLSVENVEHIPQSDAALLSDTYESNCSPSVNRQWHEAAYILSIKEKHILPQVAIDQILSTTSILFSELLSDLVRDVRGSMSTDSLQLLEKEVKVKSANLFEGISTAFKQHDYFKKHFGLVVSSFCGVHNLYYVHRTLYRSALEQESSGGKENVAIEL